MADLKNLTPAEVLDVKGKAIPYPLYLTKKKIEALEQGQVLKVLCDAPESAEDTIPRYAEEQGYQLESVKLDNSWEIYIKKI